MSCVYGYIYKIINRATNRFYIGATLSLKDGFHGHMISLSQQKHFCKLMQKDYDEFGEYSFHVEVIEEVDANILSDRENHWISKYFDNMDKCYNVKNKASKNSKWSFVFDVFRVGGVTEFKLYEIAELVFRDSGIYIELEA